MSMLKRRVLSAVFGAVAGAVCFGAAVGASAAVIFGGTAVLGAVVVPSAVLGAAFGVAVGGVAGVIAAPSSAVAAITRMGSILGIDLQSPTVGTGRSNVSDTAAAAEKTAPLPALQAPSV